jgi:hypothetical protein
VEQLLYPVLELIGLLFAQVLEPWPVVSKLRVGHGGFQHLVVEPVHLEWEKQQLGGDGGDLLLDVAEEFLPRRVRRVGGIEQARVGDDAPHEVAQGLVVAHGFGERASPFPAICERGELAGIVCLHRLGGALRGFEIGLERRRIGRAVQILEVPLGQDP